MSKMLNLSLLKKKETTEDRRTIVKKAVKILQKNGYRHLKFIENDDIVKEKCLKNGEKVTVKISNTEYI